MYIIKWRVGAMIKGHHISAVQTGERKYKTFELAQKQVAIWATKFPKNYYYIELAK